MSGGRVLTGIAVGMSAFGVQTYIAEVSASAYRGAFGAVMQLQVRPF